MTLKLFVFEGLCNRVNGLASALATGLPIEVHWAVNVHCPVTFEDVFPAPLNGIVSVHNEDVEDYFPYRRSAQEYCYFYPTNITGQDEFEYRTKMRDAYDHIFASLFGQGAPPDHRPPVGLSFRQHFPTTEVLPWRPFVRHVLAKLHARGLDHVWVASDAEEQKHATIEFLEKRGIRCSFHTYKLLTHDLDRSPDQIRAFVKDLQGLHACREFYLNNTRTTICDRFFFSPDVRLNYVFDDGVHRTEKDSTFFGHPNVHVAYQPGLLKRGRFAHLFVRRYRTLPASR